MNMISDDSSSASFADAKDLATWNRPRSTQELRKFVDALHSRLPQGAELEVE